MPSKHPALKQRDKVLRRSWREDKSAAKGLLDRLADVNRRLAEELTVPKEWDVVALDGLLAVVRRLLADLGGDWQGYAATRLEGMWRLGEASVDATMEAGGYLNLAARGAEQRDVFLPLLPEELLRAASRITAELVAGVTEQARRRIVSQIVLAVLGDKNPYDAMKEITDIRGIKADPVKGVAYNAERIVRTEMTRAFNMAAQLRQEQWAERVPEMKKEWVSALVPGRTRDWHAEAHGQVVPVDEPFIVMGEELMHPGDPAGSGANTINCLCRSLPFMDDWGS